MNLLPSSLSEAYGRSAFQLSASSVLDSGDIKVSWSSFRTSSIPQPTFDAIRNVCSPTVLDGFVLSYLDASGEEIAIDAVEAEDNAYRVAFAAGEAASAEADFVSGDPFGDVALRIRKPFVEGLLAFGRFEGLRGEKVYELHDHLGIVAAVVSDGKVPVGYVLSPEDVEYFVANVASARDFYPFGMVMPERGFDVGGYRFGFQGQETDDELKGQGNSVNYKYRMHDARMGRFQSIDPLAPDYPWNSPYGFSENRVVDAVELERLEMALVNEENKEITIQQTFVVFTGRKDSISNGTVFSGGNVPGNSNIQFDIDIAFSSLAAKISKPLSTNGLMVWDGTTGGQEAGSLLKVRGMKVNTITGVG